MKSNDEINIQKVANGYLVSPRIEPGMYIGNEAMYVFESLTALADWLQNHFEQTIDSNGLSQ